jgi:hypothetical protein
MPLFERTACASLLALAVAGCGDVIIRSESARFNPVMTSDDSPVVGTTPPPTYSDGQGGSGTSKVLTDLLPSLSDRSVLRQLHRSRSFWMEPASVDLSWELIGRVEAQGLFNPIDRALPVELGYCTATDPVSRLPAVDDDGDPVHIDTSVIGNTGSFELAECPSTQNSFNEPRFDTSRCGIVKNPCNRGVSGCTKGCNRAISQDTLYQVHLAFDLTGTGAKSSDGSTVLLAQKTFFSSIKVVGPQAGLARPLTRDAGPHPSAPIASRNNLFFSWSTPAAADGTWDENFSRNLQVARVRLFQAASGAEASSRTYVNPERVYLDDFTCGHSANTGVTSENCPQLGAVTPTNSATNLATPLRWTAEFVASALNPKLRTYIEFAVVETAVLGNPQHPIVRFVAESTSFGGYDYRSTVARPLFVENNGANDVQINSLAGSPGWAVSSSMVAVNRPFVLKARSSIPLVATRLPSAMATFADETGTLTATLANSAAPVRAGLSGTRYAYLVPLFVAPAQLRISSFAHRFLVGSSTVNPTRIRGLTLEGPDAGEFTATWVSFSTAAVCANPLDPLCLDRVMPSAGAEVYQMARTGPTCRTRDHSATVRLQVEECVTQPTNGECAATDDWRHVDDLLVSVTAVAGDQCP